MAHGTTSGALALLRTAAEGQGFTVLSPSEELRGNTMEVRLAGAGSEREFNTYGTDIVTDRFEVALGQALARRGGADQEEDNLTRINNLLNTMLGISNADYQTLGYSVSTGNENKIIYAIGLIDVWHTEPR